MAAATQVGVDARCAVAALGRLVGLADVLGELVVGEPAGRWDGGAVGVVAARETFSSWHVRLMLRCCAFSASMNR